MLLRRRGECEGECSRDTAVMDGRRMLVAPAAAEGLSTMVEAVEVTVPPTLSERVE